MKLRALIAAAVWAATPLAAQGLDDATCGVIGEYAMDLAYDAGLPTALAPDGTTGADAQGCFMTGLILSPDGPSGLRIGYLGWSGTGLQDWVAGHGLPLTLSVRLERAHLQTRIADFPAYEWSSNVINQRNSISGALKAEWDPKAGALRIETLELRNPSNAIALSGRFGGIPPEPSQANLMTVKLHELSAQIDMAGAFEVLVLTPLAAGMMEGVEDPEAAFAGYIDLARSYLGALPAPQVDAPTKSALNRFLTTLPSPTGRLSLKINAPDGLTVQGSMLLAAVIRPATPERVGQLIGSIMGGATVRADWQQATPE